MDTIQIRDNNDNIILYFEGNKFWGTVFYGDGRVEPVDESVFKYFDMFKLSDNTTKLPNEGNYKVVLDNNTNFKHYFLDGEEDLEKLFQENGKDAVSYKNYFKDAHRIADQLESEKRRKKYYYDEVEKPKSYIDKRTIIFGIARRVLMAYLLLNEFILLRPDLSPFKECNKFFIDNFYQQEDVSVSSLRNIIYSSEYLNNKEKGFFSNSEFIGDLVPIINQSNYSKAMIKKRLTNLGVASFKGEGRLERGYFSPFYANRIFVADYDRKDFFNLIDIIAHEYVHLFSEGLEYSVISEACAEIISYEYFDTPLYSYEKEQYLVKKLMETIGSYPILEYVVNGNFELIEQNVKPYLSDEEYAQFLNCLKHSSYYLPKGQEDNLIILDKLIDKIYRYRNNEDPLDNIAIAALDSKVFSRYYFNWRKANQENSYYCVPKDVYDFKEAVENELIVFYVDISDDKIKVLDYDEVMEALNDPSIDLKYNIPINGYIICDYVNFYIMGPEEYIAPFDNFGPRGLEEEMVNRSGLIKQLKPNNVM